MYKVKLQKFEGPLDLLLELIEKEKLSITDVSLATVANQYLEYLDNSSEIDPTQLADFLVVAARLILIKSKALLPEFQMDEEDEESIEDLKLRLAEYKKFKEAAKKLKELYGNKHTAFERQSTFDLRRTFYPGSLAINDLSVAGQAVVRALAQFESLQKETIKEVVSIKDKIIHIQNLIAQQAKCGFSSILKGAKNKHEAIVSFLALLELTKQRLVSVTQEGDFGEIEIEKMA